jgi:hypothetical protein
MKTVLGFDCGSSITAAPSRFNPCVPFAAFASARAVGTASRRVVPWKPTPASAAAL